MVKINRKFAALSLTTLFMLSALVSAQATNCVTDQYGNQLFCTSPQTIANAANLLQNNAIQGIGIASNVTNVGLLLTYVVIPLILFVLIVASFAYLYRYASGR